MENKQIIHENIVITLDEIETILSRLESTLPLIQPNTYLSDIIRVSISNAANLQSKLEVASDITQ